MYFGYKTQKAIINSGRNSLNEFVNPSFEKSLLREIKDEQILSKKEQKDAAISRIAKDLLARRTSVSALVTEGPQIQNNHRMSFISENNEDPKVLDNTQF